MSLKERERDIFLLHFEENGQKATAAQVAGVSLSTINQAIRSDMEFAAQYEEALSRFRDTLEAEIHRRAVKGTPEHVFHMGVAVKDPNDPDKKKESTHTKGWTTLGDLGRVDEEGFLYFVGRRDSMIKSAGFRISRTEVEEALYQSGMVTEAGVVGVPDDILGQAVTAWIVKKDEGTFNVADLTAYCSTKLPRYMMPKSIHILESLPKTPNGKIDYTSLQSMKVIADA